MTFLKALILSAILFLSTFAEASLMVEDRDYITYEHKEVTLSWAWASNYNVQYYENFGFLENEFFAPETQGDWRLATSKEIEYFLRDITSTNFYNFDTAQQITAVSFFNSEPSTGVSVSDFKKGDISFGYQGGVTADQYAPGYDVTSVYDTFYVNSTLASSPAKPIPEPLSILLFAVAFIMLQSKLRNKSV